jgi:ribonuclease Z
MVDDGEFRGSRMKACFVATVLLAGACCMTSLSTADAAPCLIVTLTGTQGGPQSYNGLAGAGTLVQYGDDASACGAVKLQFDAGHGTTMRLSQLGVGPEQLNAVLFTHMHNARPARLVRFVPDSEVVVASDKPPR